MRKKLTSYRHKKLHVFVADEDTADVNFFKSALGEIADEVKITLVHDGRELMEFLNLVIPDIIFLHANMPCNGDTDCLKAIRSLPSLDKIPVLVYSDHASKVEVYKTYILGANLFISKPRYFQSLKKDLLQKLSLKISEIVPQPSINEYVLDLAE